MPVKQVYPKSNAVLAALFLAFSQLFLIASVLIIGRQLPANDTLAYASTRTSNTDIYLLDLGRNTEARLTYDLSVDTYPVWSPNGMHIAYTSYRVDNWEIFVVDMDGGKPRRLTNNDGNDLNVTWTDDSQQIAYLAEGFGYNEHRIMGIDGGAARALSLTEIITHDPTWSEVRQQRVVSLTEFGDNEIYVFLGGGRFQQLTDNHAGDFNPIWSPDGEHIAFVSTRDGNFEIYMMDADGTHQRRLTFNRDNDVAPAWRR
jgi:Tol biopolymer transport system component